MPLKVAWDIDDTLYKVCREYSGVGNWYQVPDYDLIQVLRWFHGNGDTIYFWSAGGIDYAQTIINKLGLSGYGKVIEKGSIRPDIAFDDMETNLATVDIGVKRTREEQ